ncbi:YadA-like family protein [Variovorax boronicumulans]|uniref:YadA-like family protein n=1 Tax=Variovorax boronicumulans TaxID=436515 RepID=UPI003396EB8B
MSTGVSSLSTGVVSLSSGLSTTNSNVGSLSTTVSSIYNTGTKYFHAQSTAPDAIASGQDAVAIGPQSIASGANSFAAGNGAKATADGAVAVGFGAQATGQNATAVGTGASVTGAQGTAIGFGAVVQQSGGVALGSGSVSSRAAGAAGYMPGSATADQEAAIKATTSTQGAVSVGDAANGQFRQITGVAAGSSDSDATNVAQLKAASSAAKASSIQYQTNADGSINYNQVVLGNGQAPGGTRVSNVAAGILPTDAVNVGQLNEVRQGVQEVSRVAYSGIAMAFAMSGTYLPTLYPGEKTVGVGIGGYKGYGAIALTFKQLSDDGKMSWGAGLSTTGKDWGINAGIGWKWK